MKAIRIIAVAVAPLLAAGTVRGQATLPPILRSVGFDQRLNEQVPLDLAFHDEAGRTVRLGDYFHDKPVILVLAYYRCPRCSAPQVLNGLVRAMLDMPLTPARTSRSSTVSFDPRETPELAAAKKKTYLERYGRPGADAGWHFLTGEEDSIDPLTKAVGFRYAYDAGNDQFAHASGIMVLTPARKVSRYFYDINYSPRDLRLGLVEASDDRDRLAGRSDPAVLLPLRPHRGQIRAGHHELRAAGRRADRAGRRGPGVSPLLRRTSGAARIAPRAGDGGEPMFAEIVWFPQQASTTARHVDQLLFFLVRRLRRRRACWWRCC